MIYTYTKIQKSFGVSKARPREILNHFGQQPQYIPPEPQFFQRMRCSVSFLHFAHLRLCLCPKVELICRRLTNLERFPLWNRVEEVGDENRAGIIVITCLLTPKNLACIHNYSSLHTHIQVEIHGSIHQDMHSHPKIYTWRYACRQTITLIFIECLTLYQNFGGYLNLPVPEGGIDMSPFDQPRSRSNSKSSSGGRLSWTFQTWHFRMG